MTQLHFLVLLAGAAPVRADVHFGPASSPLEPRFSPSGISAGAMAVAALSDQRLAVWTAAEGILGTRTSSTGTPLDIPRLEPVPEHHVLTKSFYLLRSFPGRWDGGQLWVEAEAPRDSDRGRQARRVDADEFRAHGQHGRPGQGFRHRNRGSRLGGAHGHCQLLRIERDRESVDPSAWPCGCGGELHQRG